jgi:hypothetical protein
MNDRNLECPSRSVHDFMFFSSGSFTREDQNGASLRTHPPAGSSSRREHTRDRYKLVMAAYPLSRSNSQLLPEFDYRTNTAVNPQRTWVPRHLLSISRGQAARVAATLESWFMLSM